MLEISWLMVSLPRIEESGASSLESPNNHMALSEIRLLPIQPVYHES
jgi:hypothetical protein